VISLAGPCAVRAQDWAPPNAGEWWFLALSESLIAVDVMQSADMSRHPERNFYETNPLLGGHPSTERLWLMGAIGGLSAGCVWYALPSRARWIVPALLTIAESVTIVRNTRMGLIVRF
jgi:hypothetical protein